MIAEYVKKNICSKPGLLSRRIRHPSPFHAPCRASQLDLARQKGMGDVLLCTPALRELKRVNPHCYLRFFTDFAPLLDGLSYIDEIQPIQNAPPWVLQMGYEGCTPPRGHLARIIGDQLGVDITDVTPDCVVDPELANSYRVLLESLPKPHIVVLRRASVWTPNKDWPNASWNIVVEKLSRMGTAIEIGDVAGASPDDPLFYLDLRERTTLAQIAALVSVADLYVGPVSGPMHIAAAAGTPAVVIYGGYESPIGYEGYLRHVGLYSPLRCAPCWKADSCPYHLRCLTMIKPSEVIEATRALLKRKVQACLPPVSAETHLSLGRGA